jgi:hypothetical protein
MNRWHGVLHPKKYDTTTRAGNWTTEEGTKLRDAVEDWAAITKDWAAITALVPGRTTTQCRDRWHNALHSNTDEKTALKDK